MFLYRDRSRSGEVAVEPGLACLQGPKQAAPSHLRALGRSASESRSQGHGRLGCLRGNASAIEDQDE